MRRSGARDLSALKREVGVLLYAFHAGRERAATPRQLAAKLGIKSADQVRFAIAELRLERHPIASTNRKPEGYYIPADIRETNECLMHMRSRVRKICQALAGVESGLRARFGSQLEMKLHDPTKPLVDERARPPADAFLKGRTAGGAATRAAQR